MDSRRPLLTTVDEVIEALGGNIAVIVLTGRTPQAISNWRHEGRIAPYLFHLMSSRLAVLGLSADPRLWGQQGSPGQPPQAALASGEPRGELPERARDEQRGRAEGQPSKAEHPQIGG